MQLIKYFLYVYFILQTYREKEKREILYLLFLKWLEWAALAHAEARSEGFLRYPPRLAGSLAFGPSSASLTRPFTKSCIRQIAAERWTSAPMECLQNSQQLYQPCRMTIPQLPIPKLNTLATETASWYRGLSLSLFVTPASHIRVPAWVTAVLLQLPALAWSLGILYSCYFFIKTQC